MPTSPMRAGVEAHLRAILGALVVGTCVLSSLATLVCLLLVHVNREMAGNRDFVVYWATGRQLVQHLNPYDPATMPAIERAAGLPRRYSAGYMRNPPWALPLAYPLGLTSLRVAALFGSLILIGAFAISVRMLCGIHACRDRVVQSLVWLCAPALICLIWGQTSLLVLLGLALFFRFHASRPWLAGASLWLCALKPHIVLPVLIVILAWIVVSHSYRVLAGAAVTLAASLLATFWLDPQFWPQYKAMLGFSGVETDPIPSLSVLLRTHFAPNWLALQFVPVAAACVWAIAYFWNRRQSWNWSRDANLILLVSLVAAPYAYINDHVVVLPALLCAACVASSRWLLGMLAFASALLEVAFFANFVSRVPLYWATLLAPLFWLAWYWLASRKAAFREEPSRDPAFT
ncbi:MAG TPA: glycosyltransferase 87 family protein [Terracidiphilus sp.]